MIARALRDAGMEVIYTGLRQTPEQIVGAALQEDADVIGLSILSGAHMHICPRVDGAARRRRGSTTCWSSIGGIIPDVDIPKLNAMGIKGIFLPGTPMQEIVDFITANARAAGRVEDAVVRQASGRYAEVAWRMRTLLLADDNITVQRVIALTFAGDRTIQVITVADGQQAMEKMAAHAARHRAGRNDVAADERLRSREVHAQQGGAAKGAGAAVDRRV